MRAKCRSPSRKWVALLSTCALRSATAGAAALRGGWNCVNLRASPLRSSRRAALHITRGALLFPVTLQFTSTSLFPFRAVR